MSQSCNISNSSRPWGPSDEIDAIRAACSNHTSDCSAICLLPEIVKAKAREIGTITHIGGGTYANVYHWEPTPSQSTIPECAIRSIIREKSPISQQFKNRASAAQEKLKSSVFALPVYHEKGPISFMPLIKKENYFTEIIPPHGLSFYVFSDFLQEILQSLLDLKLRNLIHGDLSPPNCYWNPKACCRFNYSDLDFTTSPEEARKFKDILGRPTYRSPEAWNINSNEYSYSIDMWNAGCLAFYALTGRPLFLSLISKRVAFENFAYYLTASNMARNVRESVSGKQDLSPLIAVRKAKELSDLMSQMLKIKPEERITPEAALQHPFFRAPDNIEEFAESFPPHIRALIKEC